MILKMNGWVMINCQTNFFQDEFYYDMIDSEIMNINKTQYCVIEKCIIFDVIYYFITLSKLWG